MSKKQTIIPPRFGWKESAHYLVEISYGPGNPIHHDIFYTGFLNGDEGRKRPGGYNYLGAQGDYGKTIDNVYYMKAVKLLVSEKRFRMTRWIDKIRKRSWRQPPEAT